MSHHKIKLISALIGVPLLAACWQNRNYANQAPPSETTRSLQWANIAKKANVDIKFYGKIINQYGEPVEGAEIRVGITKVNLIPVKSYIKIKQLHIKSDKDGKFQVINEKGSDIIIEIKGKTGFDYSSSEHQQLMSFNYSGVPNPFVPDSTRPIIYRMREKEKTAVLITHDIKISFDSGDEIQEQGLDLIQGVILKGENLEKKRFNGDPVFCDLLIAARYNHRSNQWDVSFSTDGQGNGLLFSNELLYIAPKNGYNKACKLIPFPEKSVGKNYLYLKTRDKGIYSRMELDSNFNSTSKQFRITGKAVTNPFGDPVLDQRDDIPTILRIKIEKDVREAYRLGRYPDKPSN